VRENALMMKPVATFATLLMALMPIERTAHHRAPPLVPNHHEIGALRSGKCGRSRL
jgi:hypothetical protein